MNKKYVVGGAAYADIDVLACVAAYTELLRLQNHNAEGIITGPWNQTIPKSIREWPINIKDTYFDSGKPCSFVLVDISDPNFMEKFVSVDRVVEVFDHHYGFESFWRDKLPATTHIEHVGACATMIWEKFVEYNFKNSISQTSANLLYTAIFANTLNFKSDVTCERDHQAFEQLKTHIYLPKDWQATYYSEVAEGFQNNLSEHIRKDTKLVDLDNKKFLFGQVETWNAGSLIESFKHIFHPEPNEEWVINFASIDENRSYLYSNSPKLHAKLQQVTNAKQLNPSFQIASRLWLRKELLKKLLIDK